MNIDSEKFRAHIRAWIVANLCDGDPEDLQRTTMHNYRANDMLNDFREILDDFIEEEKYKHERNSDNV